jgi:hypothetical protein
VLVKVGEQARRHPVPEHVTAEMLVLYVRNLALLGSAGMRSMEERTDETVF